MGRGRGQRKAEYRGPMDGMEIITRYVPERLLTPRVQYLIEDLFDEADS